MAEHESRLFIGSHVTYGGPRNVMYGRPLLVLPCRAGSRCAACDEWDLRTGDAEQDREHFLIKDLTTTSVVRHAAGADVTPIPHTWPDDAVEFNINGYWYAAAYTTPGRSARARTVHFYTAGTLMGRTWCHFPEVTPQVRRLDEQARQRPTF
ncbi:hypothetical protein [Streptomyces chartreusis]|uniref:hypothetical protein n=1 Tax=Streptomyces chartreusis TaxID=1969 RepID=UPI001678E48F|nr:hypothetical protein [Streptomyces chartreusis]GGX55977.1 hypothetical protein GCM10010321_86540 [Streptomyces chartreusis]